MANRREFLASIATAASAATVPAGALAASSDFRRSVILWLITRGGKQSCRTGH